VSGRNVEERICRGRSSSIITELIILEVIVITSRPRHVPSSDGIVHMRSVFFRRCRPLFLICCIFMDVSTVRLVSTLPMTVSSTVHRICVDAGMAYTSASSTWATAALDTFCRSPGKHFFLCPCNLETHRHSQCTLE
jgi:hypothetical protein